MSGAECIEWGAKEQFFLDSGAVVESLNVSKNGLSGMAAGVETQRTDCLLLEDREKLSLQALSPGMPTREKLCRMPSFTSRPITSLAVYWLPRSEWKMHPLEGEQWAGKSLPVALKKFKTSDSVSVIICIGQFFALYTLLDIMQLYASLDADARQHLRRVLALA